MLIKLRGTLEIEKRFLTKRKIQIGGDLLRQHLVPKKTQMEKIYIKYLGIAVWAELQSCTTALV